MPQWYQRGKEFNLQFSMIYFDPEIFLWKNYIPRYIYAGKKMFHHSSRGGVGWQAPMPSSGGGSRGTTGRRCCFQQRRGRESFSSTGLNGRAMLLIRLGWPEDRRKSHCTEGPSADALPGWGCAILRYPPPAPSRTHTARSRGHLWRPCPNAVSLIFLWIQ